MVTCCLAAKLFIVYFHCLLLFVQMYGIQTVGPSFLIIHLFLSLGYTLNRKCMMSPS